MYGYRLGEFVCWRFSGLRVSSFFFIASAVCQMWKHARTRIKRSFDKLWYNFYNCLWIIPLYQKVLQESGILETQIYLVHVSAFQFTTGIRWFQFFLNLFTWFFLLSFAAALDLAAFKFLFAGMFQRAPAERYRSNGNEQSTNHHRGQKSAATLIRCLTFTPIEAYMRRHKISSYI